MVGAAADFVFGYRPGQIIPLLIKERFLLTAAYPPRIGLFQLARQDGGEWLIVLVNKKGG
jgi:hypothetical protein